MSREPAPPPPPPPPGGPTHPPPPGPPGGTPSRRVFAIVAAVLLAVVVAIIALVLLVPGGAPTTVAEVADEAVDAAESLDVDAGIDLLCEPPSAEDRATLEDVIAEAQDRAGTQDPEVDYEISDVEGDAEGSFRVTVSSDEEGLDDEGFSAIVIVETDGDRSCVASIEDAD